MAEPKKRTNNSKQGMRRLHDKIRSKSIVDCPNCHQPKQNHRICKNCGFYNNQLIVEDKPKSVEAEEEPSTKEK